MTKGTTQKPHTGAACRLALLIGAALSLAVPGRAAAHDTGGKISGSCQISNAAGKASMVVTVRNVWSGSVRNVTPSELIASSTGSATFFVQTAPRPVREILPGKQVAFQWKGRFYGDGLLDVSVQIAAELDDGASSSTGILNCNRIAVGNPDPGDPPTVTPQPDDPTPTPPPNDTPEPTATRSIRPTRTPISPRPTRTQRVDPSNTPTRVQPNTPTRTVGLRPTRTPLQSGPTRTPDVRPTRTEIQSRPTRTPNQQPTRTSATQPTRTPTRGATAVRPSSTPTRALPTRTPTRAAPTRTPIPQRATRTPVVPPTARPTRTPNVDPATPTPDPPIIGGGLAANCSLRRNVDFVTITMVVENRTGSLLNLVRASTLQLEPEGGALFFDRTGPSPSSASQLGDGASVSFQWTGRLSAGGTMGFSSFATATGPNGPIQTQLTDCGVTGNDSGSWDAASFDGQCTITPSENGQISVSIRNGSVEALSDVAAFFVSKTSTGTAGAFDLRGPAPRIVSNLTAGGRREFVFGARFLGDGQITMRFKGRGIRSTDQSVETAEIECTAQVGGQNTNLPDLGVISQELQDSLLIETKNFGSDSCALVEGCIDAAGSRKLLRFNTVTPNYGPGDVFLGDPLGNPEFVFSSCHNHFHFTEYADYRLLDMGGQIVARGHKQAFCLVDLWQPPGLGGDPRPQFPTCEFQGISAGWADVYDRSLDCQWIDITGVPAGHYILEVQINPAHVIKEHNYDNNVGRAEVDVH